MLFQTQRGDAPLASKNFETLCAEKQLSSTYFHRVIKNFIIQGGDTTVKDGRTAEEYPNLGDIGKDGNGTSSFNGEYFEDENLIELDRKFLVCMSNFGEKNHNMSQFFITLEKCPHLNGKHTVFGHVKHGKSIVREIEKSDIISNKNSDTNAWLPSQKILITDTGLWKENDPLLNEVACVDTIGGDIYEEYPDDNEVEDLDLENVEQSYKVTTIIKNSATLLFKAKRLSDSLMKYKKALRYCNELLPDDESNKEMYMKFQELKKTLYLNMSLIALNTQDYNACINYCGFLLQMEDVQLTNVQASKIFYRLGKSYASMKKYDVALETLNKGLIVSPEDPSIKKEFDAVKKIVDDVKKEEKARYAKFFS
ncbi:hypothetical protein PMKS-002508 [Pichia membranifaciens]|uniref:peptidylprolyl isomerase n=1 Tax=Pichia membranifaciens TaxID=4926 RepID=A0A1Q2YHK8_9ASCO|nr:hypothetical protein PMKS-002508 [Pichia membranifaciens]